jgi:hypothetical protein
MADGTWLASKWDLFTYLATPVEVENFLRRIGAPS